MSSSEQIKLKETTASKQENMEEETLNNNVGLGNMKITSSKSRTILLVLEGISLVLGLILMLVGSLVVAEYNTYLDFITGRYQETAVFILVMGIVVTVVSTIGFYAAFNTHFCLMATFLSIMVVVVVMELIAAVITLTLPHGMSHQMETRKMLKQTLEKYQDGSSIKAWSRIQTELSCCGLQGVEDYTSDNLPVSCCSALAIDTFGEPEKCRIDTATRHLSGCDEAFRQMLRRNVGLIGILAVLVAAVQISIITFSSILVKRWKKPGGHCYPFY